MKIFVVLVLHLVSSFFAVAHALPVMIYVKDHPEIQQVPRAHLIALSPTTSDFKRIPIQFDEMEEGSLLVLRTPAYTFPLRKDLHHPTNRDPFKGRVAAVHRLVMNHEDFSTCDKKCLTHVKEQAKKHCVIDKDVIVPEVFQINLLQVSKTAFVVNCHSNVTSTFEPVINYSEKAKEFNSTQFKVALGGENDFFLKSIEPPTGGAWFTGATFEALLKPKLFFALRFTEKDLSTKPTSVSLGAVGSSLELAVNAKTLGFTTRNEICCDMTIFRDALYFPVFVNLPFKGTTMREGSGLFFGVNYSGTVDKDVVTEMPIWTEKREAGAKQKDPLVVFNRKDKSLILAVRSRMGEESSIPSYFMKSAEIKQFGNSGDKSNVGVFMDLTKIESSGLQKFEVWMMFGDPKSDWMKTVALKGFEYQFISIE